VNCPEIKSAVLRWSVRAVVVLLLFAVACSGRSVEPVDVPPAPAATVEPAEPVRTLLQSLPGAEVKEVEPDSGYASAWEVTLAQPLDHGDPAAGRFGQRLILSHRDTLAPTVLITEGYSIGRNYIAELADILGANQLRVEHRYHGESKPDSMDWRYLTIDQAAGDYHRIVGLLGPLYPGKWIGAGWSKGGQTSLIYRSRYPDDLAAVVAYDAPVNLALEEPRIDAFFEVVGDSVCRHRLIQFQRRVLERKPEILPLFHWYAVGKGYEYSVGEEKALEYIVLEYPFSFWQYTEADCDAIPGEDSTPGEMLEYLRGVVSFWSYSDQAMDSAAMYQFCTQLGYYGYLTRNVEDLLSSTDYPNCAYAPRDTDVSYDPEPMRRLVGWLRESGKNIIYIYGADDPWSAPYVDTSSRNNARTFFLEGGNHFTFINTFPPPERDEIAGLLKNWLN
jgi:pimeloyl-ACP methyl ester carboxylesterase